MRFTASYVLTQIVIVFFFLNSRRRDDDAGLISGSFQMTIRVCCFFLILTSLPLVWMAGKGRGAMGAKRFALNFCPRVRKR